MIYDITQELFSCKVFPGDPAPKREILGEIAKGDIVNLTAFSMCAHNGTHVDAPSHFLADGKTLDELDPAIFLGDCYVVRHEGDVTAEDAHRMLAKAADAGAGERLLIAGRATVTLEAARIFADGPLEAFRQRKPDRGPRKRSDGGAFGAFRRRRGASGGGRTDRRARREVPALGRSVESGGL